MNKSYRPPSREALQAQCDAFNFDCSIGGRVAVKIDGKDKPFITTTRTGAQILSGHTAVVWLDGVSGCYCLSHVTPIPDAQAWCIYADNGNVRLWSRDRRVVERAAAEHGKPIMPYTPPEVSQWTTTPPTEQGWYWHWNGDPNSAPFVLSILYSGTARKCFVPMNQTANGHAEMCDRYGGNWKRLSSPALPQ
ncbi:MAG: hypothetical protein WKG03_14160 [Telluria sp.]